MLIAVKICICLFTSVSFISFLNSSKNLFLGAFRKQISKAPKTPKTFPFSKNHFPKTAFWQQFFQVRKQQKPKSQEGGGELNLVYEAMARRVPTAETHLIHPALSISLLAAWIAATIAIVAALCGTRFRKKPTPSPSESSSVSQTTKILQTGSPPPATAAVSVPVEPSPTGTEMEGEGGSRPEKTQSLEPEPEPLPLPLPPIRQVNEMGLTHMPRSVSVSQNRGGGFLVSGSINLPRSFSVAKHLPFTKEERMQGRRERSKQPDSIWTKTILLGERCRVPNDDEHVNDGKGQKIETYQPRGPRSLPVSRTNSFIDREAVPC